MTTTTYLESQLGELLLTSREGKLTGLYFADSHHALLFLEGRRQACLPSGSGESAPIFAQVRRQLEEYASGEREQFDLPIALAGTPFQLRVWREISAIPFGETVTYGEIARRIGSPGAVRVVGTAAGRNPLCWVIPCHRVVGRDGSPTGYAGGLGRKEALLAFESARASGRAVSLDLQPLVPEFVLA
jgi:methylated-DNA-[protein]-cysteine S-methyltransferase